MAQQPNYGALSDASVEQAKIERARRYAELMQQQSMQPLDTNQMAGGWVVPVSPLAGAAKMVQAYQAKKGIEAADEKAAKLAERLKSERDQADARVMAAASGAPNLATDPTRLATALPQWMTDAQPELVPKQPTRDEIRQNVLAAAMSHPEMRGQALGAMLQQLTANPESQFAKIDPSKFTAESVAKFAQSNRHADLVPRDRLDFQNIGGQVVGLNPYSGTKQTSIDTSMRPGEAARLDWDKYQFGNLSANQQQSLGIDRARLANQGIETQFNTGQGVGSPIFSGIPQNAPMQFTNTGGGTPAPAAPPAAPVAPRPAVNQPRPSPQAAPQPMPNDGLTPKQRSEIAKDNAVTNNSNARDATSILNLSQGAEAMLDKAHGSGVGNAVGGVQNFFGIDSTKNQADAQLTALSGALVSKQPKMSGPQSDKDVLLYRQMAGDIGNASLPASVRKAALKKVREIAETYKNGYSPTGYQDPDKKSENNVRVVQW